MKVFDKARPLMNIRLYLTLLMCLCVLLMQTIALAQNDVPISQNSHQRHKDTILTYLAHVQNAQSFQDLDTYSKSYFEWYPGADSFEDRWHIASINIIVGLLGTGVGTMMGAFFQKWANMYPDLRLDPFSVQEQLVIHNKDAFYLYVSSGIREVHPNIDRLLDQVNYRFYRETVENHQGVLQNIEKVHVWTKQEHFIAHSIDGMPVHETQILHHSLPFDDFHKWVRAASVFPPEVARLFFDTSLQNNQLRVSLETTNGARECLKRFFSKYRSAPMYDQKSRVPKWHHVIKKHARFLKKGVPIVTGLGFLALLHASDTEDKLLVIKIHDWGRFLYEFNDALRFQDLIMMENVMDNHPETTSILAQQIEKLPQEIKAFEAWKASVAK